MSEVRRTAFPPQCKLEEQRKLEKQPRRPIDVQRAREIKLEVTHTYWKMLWWYEIFWIPGNLFRSVSRKREIKGCFRKRQKLLSDTTKLTALGGGIHLALYTRTRGRTQNNYRNLCGMNSTNAKKNRWRKRLFFKSSISNKNYYNLFLMRLKSHYWFGSQVNAVMPRKQVNTLGEDSQYQVGTVFKRHISQWMDAANSNTKIWEYYLNTDCLFRYIPIRTTFLDVRHAFRQRRKRPATIPSN